MYSLFRKQTLRLFAQGSQHDISGPALESTLASQMSRRRASCCTSLTRDVAPHVLNVHFVEPDFSGGVSDSDCAVFVVHDLRCSFLPRRHMHLSWRTQGHRAPGSLVASPHEADVTQKCLHYTGSQTPHNTHAAVTSKHHSGKTETCFLWLPSLVSTRSSRQLSCK